MKGSAALSRWAGALFLFVFVLMTWWSVVRSGIWDETLGINLLVLGDTTVGLLVLRPAQGSSSWISLPADLKVKISGSQASYPMLSLWKFGMGEKRPYEISRKSVGEAMGVVIPRMIKVSGEASFEDVLGELLSWRVKTDLNMLDRLALRKYLSEAVSARRLLELSIPTQVFAKIEEPDGMIFQEFTQVMSAWSKDKFLFEGVFAEDAQILVNNVSGIAGAGLLLSRQVETAGMRVTEIRNDLGDTVAGEGCVFGLSGEFPMTEKLLSKHFGCKKIGWVGEEGAVKIWVL